MTIVKRAVCNFLTVTFLGMSALCHSSVYYVRSNAGGDGSGTDWENAFSQLPDKLERGSTYYVADGTYPGYQFDTPTKGDSYIYIYKATKMEHGTDAGWRDEYGDGQAVFPGLNFIYGFVVFDGKTGSGSDPTSYGFRVVPGNCDQDNRLVGMPGLGHSRFKVTDLRFSHVAIELCGPEHDYVQVGIYSVPRDESYAPERIVIANNYFSAGSSNMLIRSWKQSVIESNYFNGNWSSARNHGQQISPGGSMDDIIVRNNTFVDSRVFIIGAHTGDNERWKIYNNLVIGGVLTAAWANADSSTSDVVKSWEVHHNTYIGVNFGGRGVLFVGNLTRPEEHQSVAFNNLFFECENASFLNPNGSSGAVAYDYNSYYRSTGTYPGPNGEVKDGDPFVSSGTTDFRLNGPTEAGLPLGAAYRLDRVGRERGTDGVWDRGAYEFSGASGRPDAPGNLRIVS